MPSPYNLARVLILSLKEELPNHALLKEALIAFWETDPLTRIQKRDAVIQKGFDVHGWVAFSFEADDLTAVEDWKYPIDWENVKSKAKETLLKRIIKEDKKDWLTFAFNQGANPNTFVFSNDTHDYIYEDINKQLSYYQKKEFHSISLLEFSMGREVHCPNCFPLIFAHKDVLKQNENIGRAILLKQRDDVHLYKNSYYEKLLKSFDFSLQNKPNTTPWMQLFIQEIVSKNLICKEKDSIFNYLQKLRSEELFPVFGERGIWSWINEKSTSLIDFIELKNKQAEILFHTWEKTLYQDGLLTSSSYFDYLVLKINIHIEGKRDCPILDELFKDLKSFEDDGAGKYFYHTLDWEKWQNMLEKSFNEKKDFQSNYAFCFLLRPSFFRFLNDDIRDYWKTEGLESVQKYWNLLQNKSKNNPKEAMTRFKLF